MFNKMLYSDNLIYEYAYVLDSNENLDYTFDYFMKTTGRINTYGYRTIFSDLNELILSILSNQVSSNCNLTNHSQLQTQISADSQKFFRS